MRFIAAIILCVLGGWIIGVIVISPIGRWILASIDGVILSFLSSIYICKKLGVE